MSRGMDEPTELTPEQFEREVQKQITEMGVGLSEFEVRRLEKISAADGVYEIDVTARFDALGANFLVLIECKHHKNPIKRDVVQVLNAFKRINSLLENLCIRSFKQSLFDERILLTSQIRVIRIAAALGHSCR